MKVTFNIILFFVLIFGITFSMARIRGNSNNTWHFFGLLLSPSPMCHLVTLFYTQWQCRVIWGLCEVDMKTAGSKGKGTNKKVWGLFWQAKLILRQHYIIIQITEPFESTVKPVHSNHSWNPKFVAIVYRLLLFRGSFAL